MAIRNLLVAIVILFTASFFHSCIDEFDSNISQGSHVVVDGLLTTSDGPHVVKLYRYNTDTREREDIEEASVTIKDDSDRQEVLEEDSPGEYKTSPQFKGQVGKCYVLEVILQNGKHYISDNEEIKKAVELDSIYWENDVVEFISDLGNLFERNVINIYVDSEMLMETKQYRWRYKNIYEFITNPELNFRIDPQTGATIPDPLECSGYVADDSAPQGIRQVGACTCCQCYVTEYGTEAVVSDSRLISSAYKRVKIATFALDERFAKRVYVEVQQLSLSDQSYEFWSLISDQADNNTSFISTTAGHISSNIQSLNNNEEVLGFFGASDVSSKSIFIERHQIPKLVPESISYGDCRTKLNSTTEEPDFW